MYAESTLKRMYKKLDLSEEIIKLLHDCFEVFVNFYQRLSLKDTYKIIEHQNKGLIKLDEFIAFSETARHEEYSYLFLLMTSAYLIRNAPAQPMTPLATCSSVSASLWTNSSRLKDVHSMIVLIADASENVNSKMHKIPDGIDIGDFTI